MKQNIFDPLVFLQNLQQILGFALSQAEIKYCLKQAEFLKPKVGKFWQGCKAEAGLYIVVAGKVRLLNQVDELLTTVETGDLV